MLMQNSRGIPDWYHPGVQLFSHPFPATRRIRWSSSVRVINTNAPTQRSVNRIPPPPIYSFPFHRRHHRQRRRSIERSFRPPGRSVTRRTLSCLGTARPLADEPSLAGTRKVPLAERDFARLSPAAGCATESRDQFIIISRLLRILRRCRGREGLGAGQEGQKQLYRTARRHRPRPTRLLGSSVVSNYVPWRTRR